MRQSVSERERANAETKTGMPREDDHVEEAGTVRVNIASHQAVTRGDGAASTTSLREASYGGGESQRLVWGYCLLQGLAGRVMEDLHVAEVRSVNGEEVSFDRCSC